MNGELAALLAALFWTFTAVSFEIASKAIGSLSLNLLRLALALVFLMIFNGLNRGLFWPSDASSHAWLWLSISGLAGFVFGDYMLFRAFAMMNARISMLVMTLTPLITACIGWMWLGENLSLKEIGAMMLTLSGIVIAVSHKGGKKLRLNFPVMGLLFALGGAVGQATGLVFSKYGMGDYDAFAATQIRIMAGFAGFAVIISLSKRWPLLLKATKHKKGILATTAGSFFGPFLGVSFSLLAVQYAVTAVAATIMAIVPILLIPVSWFFLGDKSSHGEIIGAVISVAGVGIFFLT